MQQRKEKKARKYRRKVKIPGRQTEKGDKVKYTFYHSFRRV